MRHQPTSPVLSLLILVLAACSTTSAPGTSSTDQSSVVDVACPEYAGFPVVWRTDFRFEDGVMHAPASSEDEPWPLDQSSFEVVSAYWALTPNYMFYDLDPAARSCVSQEDRWMAIAHIPDLGLGGSNLPFGDPSDFDTNEWDLIIAHPWQLDRFGLPGSTEKPHYPGVVLFTDQLAVTASACDTRPNIVFIRGDALAPLQWPTDLQTMSCVTPPGVEPPANDRIDQLPIIGTPEFRDSQLVLSHDGIEYWYVAITEEEFRAAFDRNAFFEIEDPMSVLEDWEAESFDIIDNPPATTTRTTEPDGTTIP